MVLTRNKHLALKARQDPMGDIEERVLLRLADELYRVMVAEGVSPRRAASISQKLKQRARIRKGEEEYCSRCHRVMRPSQAINGLCVNCQEDDEWARKGVDDGQYYHDQPISMPRRPSGAHFQPQNPKPTDTALPSPWSSQHPQSHLFMPGDQHNPETDTTPSSLGSTHARQGREALTPDLTTCPICGQSTLAVLNALENMEEDIRCTACGARFRSSELLAIPLMREMTNVLQQYNMSNPVSIPEWKPKGYVEKVADVDLNLKSFIGFDYTKSYPQAAIYADSETYRKLLREYFSELNPEKREILRRVLKGGMRRGSTIREIARALEPIFGDPERAQLVARTEVIRLSNEGNLARMQEKGTEKVEFVSAPEDGRLCPKCKALDGKIYKLADAKGLLPIHCNCRCTVTEHYETP